MFVEVLVKMKIIVSETGKYFNTDLVGLLQRTIGIYPIGSYVGLEQRVDSLPKRLGMNVVILGIHVAADQYRAVEKLPQPDVNSRLPPRILDDVEDFLTREKG